MSKPDNTTNKTANLNIPALTKEISDQLTKLGTISDNNHTQLEELSNIIKNLSKHLTSLATAISNINDANKEFVTANNEGLSTTKEEFSTLQKNISSDVSQLQAMALKLEEKVILLTNLHVDLSLLLRNEQNRFNITQEAFSQLSDNTSKTFSTLDKLSKDFPPSVEQLKKSVEEKLISQAGNLTNISKELKAAKEQADVDKKVFRLDSRIELIILGILFVFILYCDIRYTRDLRQVSDSIDEIKEQIQSLKATPTPSPTPEPISNKTDKKRSK